METVTTIEQAYGELIPPQTIDTIVREIARNFSPLQIILFGSYASGQATPDSDLDLLVIMDGDLPRHKRATPIRLLFRPTPCAMDILVYTPQEIAEWNGTPNHVITEALRSGRVVYAR